MNRRRNPRAAHRAPPKVAVALAAFSAIPIVGGESNESPVQETQRPTVPDFGTLTAMTDDVRSEKVASLRKAVAEGSYNVNPLDVARKLIDHMRES